MCYIHKCGWGNGVCVCVCEWGGLPACMIDPVIAVSVKTAFYNLKSGKQQGLPVVRP